MFAINFVLIASTVITEAIFVTGSNLASNLLKCVA